MSKFNSLWIRRRWLDFRNGYSIYLSFIFGFLNFVIISYTLAIERVPVLKSAFPSLSTWIIIFIAGFVPVAVLIGHYHRRKQIPTEVQQMAYANPYNFVVTPGREMHYSMPLSALQLRTQVKMMEMQNALADAVEEVAKKMSADIKPIPRWDKEFFKDYEQVQEMTDRLARGESILDILKEKK
ncbi:hypothetical protein [Nitrososphaera sp.]|uniref:hypothetical protein n=1 Tax=Nitrososphaera sp. TaxID=1971748 RepID=UPI00307E288F